MLQKLKTRITKTGSILCIGLDPRIEVQHHDDNVFEAIISFNEAVISATESHCACYKPNIAFYEVFGPEGLRALKWTVDRIPSEIPIILDAKRGDLAATSESYAKSAFEYFGVDAITVSPYLGIESVTPFLKYEQGFVFILSRTSNQESDRLQKRYVCGLHKFQELYLEVADQFAALSERLGFVIGANCYEELTHIRARYPAAWVLAPGIGAQGASIEEAISRGLGEDGSKLIPVVSRGISLEKDKEKAFINYNTCVTEAIEKKLQEQRKTNGRITDREDCILDHSNKSSLSDINNCIIQKLFQYECVKFGSFTLKSGQVSPIYIDLRRAMSFPDLFDLITISYSQLIQGLSCDIIAGIPTAALPFAASLARFISKPMIYPRIPKKLHGSGNKIEGAFRAGDTVVLLDDLISKGSSKIEALEVLRDANLVVRDIIVLICRSYNAKDDMSSLGVSLHSAIHIDDIIKHGRTEKLIDENENLRMQQFFAN